MFSPNRRIQKTIPGPMSAPAAAAAKSLKKYFEQGDRIEVVYTVGAVQISADESKMAAISAEKVNIVDMASSRVVASIPGDGDLVTCIGLSPDNTKLIVASRSLMLRIYDWHDLGLINEFKVKEGMVSSIAWDASSTLMAIGTSEGVIKVWDLKQGFCTHVLRDSRGVVTALRFFKVAPPPSKPLKPAHAYAHEQPTAYFLASSASTECMVRIWDLAKKKCVFSADSHTAAVTKIDAINTKLTKEEHAAGSAQTMFSSTLVTASRDSTICVWEVSYKGPLTLVRSIATKEAIADMVCIPPSLYVKTPASQLLAAVVGDAGVLCVWNLSTQALVLSPPRLPGPQRELLRISLLPVSKKVLCINATQDMLYYTLPTFTFDRQIAGYFDEIIDIKPISNTYCTIDALHDPEATAASKQAHTSAASMPTDDLLAVVTNSEQLRIIERASRTCYTLTGHENTIISLDTSATADFIVTASKDATIRIWQRLAFFASHDNTSSVSLSFRCIAKGVGHTDAMTCVRFSKRNINFILSSSHDHTVKSWDTSFLPLLLKLQADLHKQRDPTGKGIPGPLSETDIGDLISKIAASKDMQLDKHEKILVLKSKLTIKAHDKTINCIAISPNDKEFATASHDRTIKIWSTETMALLGKCTGHKRGIWDIAYSPADKLLGSSSSDGTIKLWSMEDYSCIKTFEGHANPVLRVLFMPKGLQLISSSSDGLIKVWTIRTSECELTLDAHEDKVWALALSRFGESSAAEASSALSNHCTGKAIVNEAAASVIISGSSDSTITFWNDVTEKKTRELLEKQTQNLLDEQELDNLVHDKRYLSAAKMALRLEKPATLLRMIKKLVMGDADVADYTDLSSNIKLFIKLLVSLNQTELVKLLDYIRDWNTNSKTSDVAQLSLKCLFQAISPTELLKIKHVKELLEALLPYTERHFKRAKKFVQQTYFIDFTWQAMLAGHAPVSITDIAAPKLVMFEDTDDTHMEALLDYSSSLKPLSAKELNIVALDTIEQADDAQEPMIEDVREAHKEEGDADDIPSTSPTKAEKRVLKADKQEKQAKKKKSRKLEVMLKDLKK